MDNSDQEPQIKSEQLAQTLLKTSIESLEDVLIFSIDKDFRYLNFNNAFKKATELAYGTKVALGRSMLESITNPDDRQKAKDNCSRALAGDNHTTLESFGELETRYFETKYHPIFNGRKEIIGVVILSTDVTERKKAEKQITELNKELEAFSYSVAHDLRSPVRVINGFCEILQEDHEGDLNEECHKLISSISRNALKMNQLINELLHFSRLGRSQIELQKVPIDKLLYNILKEQINVEAKKKPEVKLQNIEPMVCDKSLIYHVFSNLIGNAVKYSHKKDKPVIEITSHKELNDIIYQIKDNGAGFDMRYADKLFGVFQRLHNDKEFPGTGVGLAIAKRIILKHNGKIWAESEVDKGATFYFSIPQQEVPVE